MMDEMTTDDDDKKIIQKKFEPKWSFNRVSILNENNNGKFISIPPVTEKKTFINYGIKNKNNNYIYSNQNSIEFMVFV